jgi:hypothetical protein
MSLLVSAAQSALSEVGLGEAELVSAAPDSPAFGDTEAVFRIGPLLLRFTRERGQEFIDLASQSEPETFHRSMTWISQWAGGQLTRFWQKHEPEPIGAVLQRLKTNFAILRDAFSGDRSVSTRAHVERAARDRWQAFAARLRGER